MADKTYNLNDPCQRVLALKDVLNQFYMGQRVASVSFNSGNGTGQTATFKSVDIVQVKQYLREAEAECAMSSGERPTRRCIRSKYAPQGPAGPFYWRQ